jgi:hypothetical protein
VSGSQWAALAEEAERMAEWEESHGRYGGVYRNKAATYRRAVEANVLEEQTGKAHCVCCLKPRGSQGDYWKQGQVREAQKILTQGIRYGRGPNG